MRIFFLGTAAAEGYPGIFCKCARCTEARALGGKNLRYRSALLVNDDLMVDFGPDVLAAAQRFNLSLWGVTTGLVTHAHSDHFYTSNFEMRRDAFTGQLPPPTMQLYGPGDVAVIFAQEPNDPASMHVELHTVHAFDTWVSGKYTITAYHAFHAAESLEALFYSIEDGKHALLYATDTGSFPEDTRQALAGRSFDVVVLEETMGDGKYNQHLGFETFLEQVQWLRANHMIRPGGRVIAHHLSHSGNPNHEQLEAFFRPHGVEVAYDGMVIETGTNQPHENDFPAKLGNPARRALAQAGYTRLEQLAGMSEAELKKLHGVGPNAIAKLRQALAAKGMSFSG
jgi:phosphoribosyl 1,2-cyclic phosphate phosphodiesterase